MIKRSYFPFLVLMAGLSLAGCETTHKAMPGKTQQPAQSFMTTGRGLSDGAVDLYQPGVDFLPTEQFPVAGHAKVSPISGNSNILINDPSVTIYNLDTMDISEPVPAPLPPLQPPINLQGGSYPSPFDKNGNPTK